MTLVILSPAGADTMGQRQGGGKRRVGRIILIKEGKLVRAGRRRAAQGVVRQGPKPVGKVVSGG
jgi:hypothetical protein